MTAAAWGYTTAGLILAGAGAYAAAVLSCGSLRGAADRARWAWRCRGHPPITAEITQLEEWERAGLITIRRGRKRTARPERTRA